MTWLSTDGGVTWRTVPVPVSQGASSGMTGVAAGGGGFVAVRPLHSGQGGVVYASANGSSWRYVTRLSSASGLKITAVNGGTGGYSVLGQVPRGAMYGFTSTDGTHWKKAASFGQAPGTTTGAAITAGGVLIATGATSTSQAGAGAGERPYLAVAGPGHDPQVISMAGLAGASISQTGVTAVAVDGQRRVVVGEQDGTLAVWSGPASASQNGASQNGASQNTPGTWATATGLPPAVHGTQRLTSVVHGPAGWLATGEAVAGDGQLSGRRVLGRRPQLAAGPVPRPGPDARGGRPGGGGRRRLRGHRPRHRQLRHRPGRLVLRLTCGPGPASAPDRVRPGCPAPASWPGWPAARPASWPSAAPGIDPAVWTSADGRHWTTHVLKIPGTGARAQLSQVAVSGRTVVAFGQETWPVGRSAALAEVSHDGGRTWTPVPFAASGVPAHGTAASTATVTAVTAMSGGFTAVGSYGPARDRDVQVWTSANGNGWLTQTPHGTGLSGPGLQQISGLAAAGTALTGVGFTATATGEQPTLWPVPAR